MKAAFLVFMLFLLCAVTASAAGAATACSKRVNPNKVVVFIDCNYSYLEIESAAKAACERGESLLILPFGYEDSKYVAELQHEIGVLVVQNIQLGNTAERTRQIAQLTSKLKNKKNELRKVDAAFVQKRFVEMALQGKQVRSLIISGHDGGGKYHGDAGSVSKGAVFDAIRAAESKNKKFSAELHSAFLWGCFTSTPEEVLAWKAALPSMEVVAGFYGMGPSNTQPSGIRLLRELMMAEDEMIGTVSSKKLLRAMGGVRDLEDTNHGVYVRACNDIEWYKFANKGDNGVDMDEDGNLLGEAIYNEKKSGFVKFPDAIDCRFFNKQLGKQRELLRAYDYGKKPIPVQTTGTDLRALYTYVRQGSHCLQAGDPLNGDHVGLLLFFHPVKENFGRVFAGLTATSEKEFRKLDAEFAELENTELSFLKNIKRAVTPGEVSATSLFADFRKILAETHKKYWAPTRANMKLKDRAAILDNTAMLSTLVSHPLLRKYPAFAQKMAKLKLLSEKMEKYLTELDPACMDFLEWHEVVEGRPPVPRC